VARRGVELELLRCITAQSQKVVTVKSAMTTGAPAANAARSWPKTWSARP
jgi:hypothetical protein